MFEAGTTYTRRQIREALGGGSLQSYLPTVAGRVVCACLRPDLNPQAPRVIRVGRGKIIESAGALLAAQSEPLPVFTKHATNAWAFRGYFRVEAILPIPPASQDYAPGIHPPVTKAIFMRPAEAPPM